MSHRVGITHRGLDHRHHTPGGVDVRELQADVAVADDGDPAGQPFQVHRLITGEHVRPSVSISAKRLIQWRIGHGR